MKILENSLIKDHYECIIIGAGNGGLSAGALLAKKGVDVLVIDQHYLPGGCVSAVRRKDITCDVGASLLFGFTPEGWHPEMDLMNDLEEPIDMLRHESVLRIHWPKEGSGLFGHEITFSKDMDKFLDEMTSCFPANRENLLDFYNYLMKVHGTFANADLNMIKGPTMMSAGMKMLFKDPIGTIRVLRLMNKPGLEVFNKFLKGQYELQKLFDLLTALFTVTILENTPSVICVAMFAELNKGGCCYPVGSPQMLSNKLELAIERNGGHILYRHYVKDILFKEDKKTVYGVRLSNGTEITANQIISAVNIYHMYGQMIPKEYIDPKKYKWIQGFVPTTAALLIYMGVDKEVVPERFHHVEGWVEDVDAILENNFVYVPSLEDKTIVPEDAHSITILSAEPFDKWPRPDQTGPDDPMGGYRSEQYYKEKEKATWNAIKSLQKYYPKMTKEHIRFIETATPSTLERFTIKHKGNIGGPALSLDNATIMKRPSGKTEFKNLYMAGDSTTIGEGVISTSVSGYIAANYVLKHGKYAKMYPKRKYPKNKYENNIINYIDPKTQELPKRIPLPTDEEELTNATAKRLALQCQWCEDKKTEKENRGGCLRDCPAKIDVLNFIRRIESGNYGGAARVIREMNPLGEICGYICPAEKMCESNCYRLTFDERSTQIKRLQAWTCKEAGQNGWEKYVEKPNGKKIAVVGAGPAGLTCSHYLGRLGYSVDVYEKSGKAGGMLSHVIPPSRLPEDTVSRDITGLSNSNINYLYNKELGKDVLIPDLASQYDSIFLAPGLWTGRTLKLPGMENSNVIDALSFIKTCREKGKVDAKGKVLVIGGGSVAADAVLVARESGVKDLTLVCLESKGEMPALQSEVDEILECGCTLENSLGPKEISEGKVVFMECSSVFDSDGKFSPKFNESKLKEIAADTIIMAVGQGIESNLESYLEKEFGKGLLKVDSTTQLVQGKDKIYAGGDIIRGAGTVVESVADGRRAAMAIHEKLLNNR